MTKEWYQQNGYKLGLNFDQAQIDRAEQDVMSAYVLRILPGADPSQDQDVARTVADLAFLLLSRRNTFVTRSGAKEKTGVNSYSVSAEASLSEMASTCKLRLEELGKKPGAVSDAKVRDICKIRFTSNYFHV